MPAETYTANMVARIVQGKTRKPCDAKRVRSWARGNIARFDDDGYTSHAYSGRERDLIVAALVKRARPDATGQAGRASSASRGRAKVAKVAKVAASTETSPDVA